MTTAKKELNQEAVTYKKQSQLKEIWRRMVLDESESIHPNQNLRVLIEPIQ